MFLYGKVHGNSDDVSYTLTMSEIPAHRFEDIPGVRRHLVRKSTKTAVVHLNKDHAEPSTRSRKVDRTPHEVSPRTLI